MRVLTRVGITVGLALSVGVSGQSPAGCDPSGPAGDIQFICNQSGPEDLALVPGGEWVIASAYARDKGGIRLINVRDKTVTTPFPTPTPRERLDAKTYAACPGPVDPTEQGKIQTHGLSLVPGTNLVHKLYVVHHGFREAIEVFEVDARAKPPTFTWIGCAVAPEPLGLNEVVALPEGGFAVTNWLRRDTTPEGRAKMQAGENNGEIWEWHTGSGWTKVPGSDASGANGLEISKDGKWLYVAEWGSQKFLRVSRGQMPVKRDEIPVGFRIDNLQWAPDGTLFAAGQEGTRPSGFTRVIKIQPETMTVQELYREPNSDLFSGGTVALQVGQEIWVGAAGQGDRIARLPATPSQQPR